MRDVEAGTGSPQPSFGAGFGGGGCTEMMPVPSPHHPSPRNMPEFRSMFQVLLGREPTEDEKLDAMIRFDWTP